MPGHRAVSSVVGGSPHPPIMRSLAAAYGRSGVGLIKRAMLFGQVGLALVVAVVGPLLTKLFVPTLSDAELVLLAALVWVIYLADAALAMVAIRPQLRMLEQWARTRDDAVAGTAWRAASEVPFAPLRRRTTAVLLVGLMAAWDLVTLSLAKLPASSLLLLLPGSILVWLYWLALRFMLSEQLMRPILADISTTTPNTSDSATVRVTLAQRMFLLLPAITVFAGTVVAGVVGNHTVAALAVGIVVSTAVAAGISGLLIVLVTRSVTEPVADLREAADRVGSGDLDVRLPVTSSDEIGVLARSFNTMVAGLRERDRIRATFDTYVDPAIAEHILTTGGDSLAAGEDVEITALFLDVRGFTGFAEQRPARQVVAALNGLFATAVPILHAHGGHVDKFIGDGLLAVFGVPRRHTDHADRALAAALDIAAAVDNRPAGELRVGIGLNSGSVVVGNLGGAGRFDFTVIGDTVNVAARVEAATRTTGDTILLSEYTHRLLRPDVRAADAARPSVPLKGRTQPVVLFAPTRPDHRPADSAACDEPNRRNQP
jgi:class 3 adenylate cyclase